MHEKIHIMLAGMNNNALKSILNINDHKISSKCTKKELIEQILIVYKSDEDELFTLLNLVTPKEIIKQNIARKASIRAWLAAIPLCILSIVATYYITYSPPLNYDRIARDYILNNNLDRYSIGDVKDAIKMFEKNMNKVSLDIANKNNALKSLAKGDKVTSINILKAISESNTKYLAYNDSLLGLLYFLSSDYKASLEKFLNADKLNPDQWDYVLNIVRVNAKLSRHEELSKWLKKL